MLFIGLNKCQTRPINQEYGRVSAKPSLHPFNILSIIMIYICDVVILDQKFK